MNSPPLRLAVILNETAGTAEPLGPQSWRERLSARFTEHDVVASCEVVSGADLHAAAQRALDAAKLGELDGVVIGGGDGSIRTVASLLAGTDVPLGIIPLGTRNHFARDLGLPLAPEEAVAVIAAAVTRKVDVAEVNGQIFINNSSIGLYPYLVLARERKRPGTWLPKWLAMILALPEVVRYLPIFRLTIRLEGVVRQCRSPIAFIGNNEYQLALPTPGRRERLDRGELWVYVANAEGWLAIAWSALRAILGFGAREKGIDTFKGPAAEILSRRHHVLVACDGEVERLRTPLRYRSRPEALRVFAPAPA